MEKFLYDICVNNRACTLKILEENLEIIKLHKIKDIILSLYNEFKIDGVAYEEKINELKSKNQEFTSIISELNKHSIDYIVIKGIVLKNYYPEGLLRQSFDYDIVIKDLNEFYKFYQLIKKRGYGYQYFPQFTNTKAGVKGLIKFEKYISKKIKMNIEVNVGGFLVSELTWLEFNSIKEEYNLMYLNDTPIKYPSTNVNLAILAAEISGKDNKLYRLRELIDYKFLCLSNDIDKEKLKFIINHYNLQSNMEILRKKVHSLDNNLNVTLKQNHLSYIKKMIHKDCTHMIPYAYKQLQKPLRTFLKHYLRELGSFMWKKDKLLSQLSKFENHFLNSKSLFGLGILVNFIPINSTKRASLEWYKWKEYHIVFSPIGTFVASTFCVIDQEKIDQIKTLFDLPSIKGE